jgi:esterase/lipase superfamily enzyme
VRVRATLKLIIVAVGWLATVEPSRTQQPQVIGNDPTTGPICVGPAGPAPCSVVQRYILAWNYVAALEGNADAVGRLTDPFFFQQIMEQTGGTGVYPILGYLGSISGLNVQPDNDASSFRAQVSHQHGQSEWLFRLDPARMVIVSADLLSVTLQSIAARTLDAGVGPLDNLSPDIGRDSGGIITDIWGRRNLQDRGGPSNTWNTTTFPCSTTPDSCGPMTRHFTPDKRLVEFLFATDRVPQNGTQSVAFSGDRQSALTFGAVSVHVPETHKEGRIELPSVWKVWGFELRHEPLDETKHFVVRQIKIMPLDEWGKLIRETKAKSALVFVHGFNTSFEDAVYRNAQVVYDLDYHGLSILYSWSSRGSALDYRYDLDSALHARDGFIFLLKKLRDEYGIDRVDVLAHSMGNLVVLDALKNSGDTAAPAHVDELIMAAPDVARDVFEKQLLPAVQKICAGTTLYVSSADKALAASKAIAIYPRAGDVPSPMPPVILPGLDTIDVTAIGDEFLGMNHSEFATNRAVIDDLKILIDKRERASRLSQIRIYPETAEGAHYWRYVP